MTVPPSPSDPWSAVATDWSRFQSPFRPHRDDTAVIERVARTLHESRGSLDAAILGLTIETATWPWPNDTRLCAFDSSVDAIAILWPPPEAPPGAAAKLAQWTALPVADGALDLVTADGSLVCVDYPAGARALFEEVRRVLRPGGRFVARTFLRPGRAETLAEILEDLEQGRIHNPFVLKLRVDAALHEGLSGFSMHEKWLLWRRLFPDQEATARRFGWPLRTFALPASFETQDLRFVYPTIDELRAIFSPLFREMELCVGSYELAERCPTLVLEPR